MIVSLYLNDINDFESYLDKNPTLKGIYSKYRIIYEEQIKTNNEKIEKAKLDLVITRKENDSSKNEEIIKQKEEFSRLSRDIQELSLKIMNTFLADNILNATSVDDAIEIAKILRIQEDTPEEEAKLSSLEKRYVSGKNFSEFYLCI